MYVLQLISTFLIFLLQVSDEIASQDAKNLYDFLVRRGYVEDSNIPPLTNLNKHKATPMTGVDMIEATVPGLIVWKVKAGDQVVKDQVVGEIVSIDNVDAPRVPIITHTSGLVYGINNYRLAVPGEIVMTVTGDAPLEWRKLSDFFP